MRMHKPCDLLSKSEMPRNITQDCKRGFPLLRNSFFMLGYIYLILVNLLCDVLLCFDSKQVHLTFYLSNYILAVDFGTKAVDREIIPK